MKIPEMMDKNLKRLSRVVTGSLTTKLILLMLVITLVPLCISSFVSYNNSTNILKEEYIKSNLKLVNQGARNIYNYLEALNQLSLSPYANSEFIRNADFEPSDFTGAQYNEKFLKSMLFSRDDLAYLYYYIINGKTLYSFSKQMYASHDYSTVEGEQWLASALASPAGLYLMPQGRFTNYEGIGNVDADYVISFNRCIKDISTNKIYGVLSLVVDNRKLGELCTSICADSETVALADSSGGLFYYSSADTDSFRRQFQPGKMTGKSDGYYTVSSGSEKIIMIYCKTFNGLVLIKGISYRLIEENVKKSLKMNLVIILLTFILVLTLSILISYSITRPVKRLAKNMKKVGEGNFNVEVQHAGNDEIGLLTVKFNEMTKEINELVNSEYKLKIAKKNAQLRALQAQINPHFMYNALQSIGTLALRREAPEIYAMANAIANMLRYSLKSSNDLVTLGTEIENMNNYLYVQKVRFGGRLTIETDIDEDTKDYLVPRLILQPLLENSIKYGIDDNKPEETITVTAACENSSIIIKVKDTGRGIDNSSLNMIKEWLEQQEENDGDSDHMGIKNVMNRIRLIYGKQAGITLESKIGEGTEITIKLPMQYGGE